MDLRAADITTGVGLSLLRSATTHPSVEAKTKNIQVSFEQAFPLGPRAKGLKIDGPILFVEPAVGDKQAIVGFLTAGPELQNKETLDEFNGQQLDTWLKKAVAEKTKAASVGMLVLRAQANSFEQTLGIVQRSLQAQALKAQPPKIRLEYGCSFSPDEDGRTFLKNAWGKRTPNKPCF